jgi:hypothetical protein
MSFMDVVKRETGNVKWQSERFTSLLHVTSRFP